MKIEDLALSVEYLPIILEVTDDYMQSAMSFAAQNNLLENRAFVEKLLEIAQEGAKAHIKNIISMNKKIRQLILLNEAQLGDKNN